MSEPSAATRRDFLKTSAVVAGTTLASGLVVPAVHAAGSDVLKVGLVGCGSRGTGAAMQALKADPHTRLVALGDAFSDRLEDCLSHLKNQTDIGGRIEVPAERRFTGFGAYKAVIESSDVVLLATPPGFRPIHLRAAIDAGKHVFCEKPMAVDGPGVRKVLEAAQEARKKNLSLVSGFCWRRHPIMRETMKRVHDGAIGDIVAMQASYNTGPLWVRTREPGWSDMEYQMRDWYYYAWLSGDFNVEQHIHSLDKIAWARKNEYPVKAVGLGGRQVRTGKDYGHIFDHHAVVYEYANGTRLFSFCRQQAKWRERYFRPLLGHPRQLRRDRHLPAACRDQGPEPLEVERPRRRRHVPDRTRRAVRQHPRRQTDQRRRMDGPQHADGHHGPHGHIHRPGDQLEAGDELDRGPVAADLRHEGVAAGAEGGVPGITKFM